MAWTFQDEAVPDIDQAAASQAVPELDQAVALVRRAVRETAGYVPGLQPPAGSRLVKLNTNENPYPPSQKVVDAVRQAAGDGLRLYPSPASDALRAAAARLYGLAPEQVLCGNGSDEVLAMIMRAFVGEGDTISCFQPSYSLYPVLAALARAHVRSVPLPRAAAGNIDDLPVPAPRARVFFLTTPNSPYGMSFPAAWVARLLESFPGIVVADEAYVDFARESCLPLLSKNPRLIIARSLSKAYSLAGMRVGLAFAHPRIIAEMHKVRDSYNLNRVAQAAAIAALEDQEHLARTRARIVSTREGFSARLEKAGFTVIPSQANFVFAVPPRGPAAETNAPVQAGAHTLFERLQSRGFLVRHFGAPELSDGIRISMGTEAEMDELVRVIEEEISAR